MEVLNSFHKVVFLAYITTQFTYPVTGQEVFSILRNPGDGNHWTDLDYFKLPESKCSTLYCSEYSAYLESTLSCHCKCSYYQEATFGFYSGSWTCLSNIQVRQQPGCQYKFENEFDGYPLKILAQGQRYKVILPSVGCSVDLLTSRFFTCDGRWTAFSSQSFTITTVNRTRNRLVTRNTYLVNIGSDISDDLVGRIISLGIKCSRQTSCLLFKLQGRLQCNENVTLKTTSRPTSAKQVSGIRTSAASTTSAPNITANSSDIEKNKEKLKAESEGSSAVVGIVVTLVIIVTTVIVIVAYLYLKRKRGERVWLADVIFSRVRELRSSQPKEKQDNKTKEESEYAEIPENQQRTTAADQAEDIYSYAFDDPQSAYMASQPAPYNILVHNRGQGQQGAIYATADEAPMYNVLERPLSEDHDVKASETLERTQDIDPVYHFLEDPSAERNQNVDPVYHFLEEPSAESTQNVDPVYHMQEPRAESTQDISPLYHFLEDPSSESTRNVVEL